MTQAGIQTVRLTGGECLVRSDLLQIIDHLQEGGVQIETILTNGALLDEELLRAFEEHGVRCGFDISFDGTDGCHDWLRGVEGAERATIRAFELCREHGFPTGAQLILHRGARGSPSTTSMKPPVAVGASSSAEEMGRKAAGVIDSAPQRACMVALALA